MSYFNHAYQKMFLGTKGNQVAVPGTAAALDQGFIMESGIHTSQLANAGAPYSLGPGTFGMFDANTWQSLTIADLSTNNCCPLVLAAASLKLQDKQGPFHGGYQESNKSKTINPKFVREFYRVDQCTPQQNIVHVGITNYTGGGAALTLGAIVGGTGYANATNVPVTGGSGSGMTVNITTAAGVVTAVTINNPGSGYTAADVVTITGGNADATVVISTVDAANAGCCIPFYCDETYYLRVEVKGSPALRFANHNLNRTLQADGGCCPGPTPTEVDSTLIYIQWAQAIATDPYMQSFVQVVVFDESGIPWFFDAAQAAAAGWPTTQIWANYVSPGHTPGACGGMRLMGAYVDTVFGNCTFQITDHYEVEPVIILASLTDLTGDPCVFDALCVIEECPPLQGMGFGETVLRELILSESYLQNFLASNDLRIREITQGNQIVDAVNRGQRYTRYYIQHSVPRYNNPSGVFDNEQYLLCVVTQAPSAGFEAFMTQWLEECTDCTALVVRGCTPCIPVNLPTP